MKTIIITGCPRTGSTPLTSLLYHSKNAVVTNEMGTFHRNSEIFAKKLNNISAHNKNLLDIKGWSQQDLLDFVEKKIIKPEIELFGDKSPDYCFYHDKISYLSNTYPDAYFIFTYRNPCAVVYSFLKRTRVEPDKKQDWYAETIEEALDKIVVWTLNWSTLFYPRVKNKIIIDYDDYSRNTRGLIDTLNSFLQTTLDIHQSEKIYYRNNLNEFIDNFSDSEIEMINNKYSIILDHVNKLKSSQ